MVDKKAGGHQPQLRTDFSFFNEERKGPDLQFESAEDFKSDDEDEFFDALENTQALQLAQMDECSSPTLKLVEKLCYKEAARVDAGRENVIKQRSLLQQLEADGEESKNTQ